MELCGPELFSADHHYKVLGQEKVDRRKNTVDKLSKANASKESSWVLSPKKTQGLNGAKSEKPMPITEVPPRVIASLGST